MGLTPNLVRTVGMRNGLAAARLATSPLLRWRLRQVDDPAPRVLLVGVYGAERAGDFSAVVMQAVHASWDVRLWALDDPTPDLAPYTRESGPTARFAALHHLATAYEPHPAEWIVITDDDVAIHDGGLARLVALSAYAQVTLGAPAQDPRGYPSHEFTWARPFSVMRETRFVEGGPMVCIRREWWHRMVEPCLELGMGWGSEVLWSDQRRAGARLAIVDAVPVRHLAPPGQRYDQAPERARLQRLLDDRGLASLRDLQVTLATWRPWRRNPPWVSSP